MPTENEAWKWGRIALPTSRSTAAASALMDTLVKAKENEMKNCAAVKSNWEGMAMAHVAAAKATE